MSVNAVATPLELAERISTRAPICATPWASRTTPDTAAVEPARQTAGATVRTRMPTLIVRASCDQLRCTVPLCVDGLLLRRRAWKRGPVERLRLASVIAIDSA